MTKKTLLPEPEPEKQPEVTNCCQPAVQKHNSCSCCHCHCCHHSHYHYPYYHWYGTGGTLPCTTGTIYTGGTSITSGGIGGITYTGGTATSTYYV